MRSDLFILGGLAHDAERVLTAVYRFALVGIKCRGDFLFGLNQSRLSGFELRITALTDAENWGRASYDSECALWHDRSLAHLPGSA